MQGIFSYLKLRWKQNGGIFYINPFMTNGISHRYQVNSPFLFKGCWLVFFIFIQILIEYSANKQWRPDQMPRSLACDLGLHYLPMSHKKDARLICYTTVY